MSGNIHVYGQWSSFRKIKGKSPGKQIFPCRGSDLHYSSYTTRSQCHHFLLATFPYQHECFSFFSFYLSSLTMCQRGEICPVLFRKLCCPQLKRNISSALAIDHANGCYSMSTDIMEWQNFHGQLIRREKPSILQTLVTWWPLTTSQAFTRSLKYYIHP